MQPIVIIGSGLAGYSLAREIRKLDTSTSLILITRDSGAFYSKPTLSNAYTLGKTPENIPVAQAEAQQKELNAMIMTNTEVVSIEPQQHLVKTSDEAIPYTKLVLALGADQIRVPLAGDGQDYVHSINDLDDYAKFRIASEHAKKIVVLGAGLIGCEFANDLLKANIHCEVIDPAPYPLSRLLPEKVGKSLQDELADLGVRWHFGTTASAINVVNQQLQVTLANGTVIEADLVLSSIGLRPRTTLANLAGLDTNRGITVNRYLQTTNPDIYALGDCAEVEGLVLPFVLPIMHSSRALAKTLTGTATAVTYPAMPVMVKTTSYPMVIASPRQNIQGEWRITQEEKSIKALFYSDSNTLEGFALTGKFVGERTALAKELPAVL